MVIHRGVPVGGLSIGEKSRL